MSQAGNDLKFGRGVPDENKMPPIHENCVFFFDIDGTLADLAPTPDAARIPQPTLDNLAVLHKKYAVALVSGRSISSIDELTHPLILPAAGQHGLEIRFSDSGIIPMTDHISVMSEINKKVEDFVAQYPDLVVEYKGLSVAIHYRQSPGLAKTVRRFALSCMMRDKNILFVQQGKMVEEIRLSGGNKGTAIKAFMQCPGFYGKTPIFAGDDKTDEDAFEAVNLLGGISIQIGSLSRRAHYSLPAPQNLRIWINEIVTTQAGSR
jgi:trehalose 6-phosphate phosphatase